MIEALALLPAPEGLVFKGGTALRLCHFEAFRYSADLDFSLVGLSEDDALDLLRGALADASARIELPRLELVEGPPREIQYEGPLGRARRIKLDIGADELVLDGQPSPLIVRYPDQTIPPPRIPSYTLVEVGGEKLRCVIQRLQCRDPFDLHRLLVEEGVDAHEAWEVFEQKARHKRLDPNHFKDRFNAREPEYAKRWNRELSEHVSEVPHFEETFRALRRVLRDLM